MAPTMRRASILLLVLAIACAGKPELHFAWDHAASFTNLKTWTWYDDPNFQMPGGSSIVDGRFVDERVRAAVAADMAKKGLTKTDGKADVYVSYATRPDGVVSQDKFGSYYWWSYTVVGGTKHQKQGTLTLDIRDSGDKLIWRASKMAILGTNPEALSRNIDDAVEDLLSKFPPPPGAEAK
jgi:Domain of unknown function (DUF4136)